MDSSGNYPLRNEACLQKNLYGDTHRAGTSLAVNSRENREFPGVSHNTFAGRILLVHPNNRRVAGSQRTFTFKDLLSEFFVIFSMSM